MEHKSLSELMALYDETFASDIFFDQIYEYAKTRGIIVVMSTMRKAKSVSNLLGWENASFALFEAILFGDLQTEIEEGEANAEQTD